MKVCRLLFMQLLFLTILLAAVFYMLSPADVSARLDSGTGVTSAGNEVEVLILLKDQADTRAAAALARKSLPPGANGDQQKAAVRSAVFEILQDKAASGQAPLLKFLEAEKGRGKVTEIKSFYLVNLVYARVSGDLVERIARRPEVDSIWPNFEIRLVEPLDLEIADFQVAGIEWNISHIGAQQVWQEFGIEGSGAVVGVIDTGVDWQHEALMAKYRGYNPSDPNDPSHAYNWFDPYYGNPYPDDYHGHGSHCAGTVLGSDPAGDNLIGVAPGAQWIAARGLRNDGTGTSTEILAAMQFMLAPTQNIDGTGPADPTLAPDVVNNSWSGDAICNPIYKEAVTNWRSAEILPVFAAGNAGPDPETIGLPATYLESFAVGAIDSGNNLASFSSRGPGACGDFWKPNISAPGVYIRSVQSYKPTPGQPRDRGYSTKSGTSMAAPHIAGVAALLRSADSALSVYEMEQVMIDTALPLTDGSYPDSPNYGYGYGLVDAFAAIVSVIDYTITVTASPEQGGTVSGGGVYSHGSGVTVTAEANEGYTFLNWREGGEIISTDSGYIFTALSDRDLAAYFEIKQYTLTYLAGENGTIAGETHQVVDHGDSGTAVEAVPDEAYFFVRWSDEFTENPRVDNNVTENITVMAEFDLIEVEPVIDYDFFLTLGAGWNLLSLPYRAEELYLQEEENIEAWLTYREGAWLSGSIEDLSNPALAVFIKVNEPTVLYLNWAKIDPVNIFAEQLLYSGWNLIGCGLQAGYGDILADLRYDGINGLTQIFAPNSFNGLKEEGFYLPWISPLKNLIWVEQNPEDQMFPFDGYWVYLSGFPAVYSTPAGMELPERKAD